ncbi:NERD domain-containing protein [Acinetobacter ursingii]|uniref:NERD domain-containing protein n=1 Tax=Acinetobacter ursingii TaxID=108980 RepID=UPI00124D6CFD|nr:prepilin peptidase [Acinetobacter ursingii]
MSEKELIQKLSELCKKPGYIHALALYTLKSFFILYEEKLRKSDIAKANSRDNLIRNEQNLLLLLLGNHVDETQLTLEEITTYIEETRVILNEIHQSINNNIFKNVFQNKEKIKDERGFFQEPEVWREAIFYVAESAYYFQYKELIYLKFINDNDWFKKNKGFNISEGLAIIETIHNLLDLKRSIGILNSDKNLRTVENFSFTVDELIKLNSTLDFKIVEGFIQAFLRPKDDANEISKIDDFNILTATPIIGLEQEVYFIAHMYSLYESFYESPFYWMNADKKYCSIANKNRGDFTENIAESFLLRVFGRHNVYKNINIYDGKDKLSEIDVLVVFSNYAIILQAKSKKLTLLSKQGNEISLQKDFKLAIQDSYDQALICSKSITNSNYKLIDASGNEIHIIRI